MRIEPRGRVESPGRGPNRGYDNRAYDNRAYGNRYDNRPYAGRGYDNRRYDTRRYDNRAYNGRRYDNRSYAVPRYGYRPYVNRTYVHPYGYRPHGYPGWSFGFYFGRPYGAYGYPAYGYPPYGYYTIVPGRAYGSVRIVDAPRGAQVLVDGYYAGIVDDYDGVFQRLNLEPGEHRIEIELPGYPPVAYDIYIEPGRTLTLHAVLP